MTTAMAFSDEDIRAEFVRETRMDNGQLTSRTMRDIAAGKVPRSSERGNEGSRLRARLTERKVRRDESVFFAIDNTSIAK
jgi:hypothetical protein